MSNQQFKKPAVDLPAETVLCPAAIPAGDAPQVPLVIRPCKNARELDTLSPLGPPVERLESGYQLFSVVYVSRGTPPPKKKDQRALLGDPV